MFKFRKMISIFYVNISKIFKAFDRFTIICISKPYSEITSKKTQKLEENTLSGTHQVDHK